MKSYISISMMFVLLGCEVIVDIKIPEEKPKLTLNSFFNPDSLWRAELSLNRHILNNKNFQRIDDALLVVYEGENPVDTLISKGAGIYKSDSGKPLAGRTYQIKAITESYGTVVAKSNVPPPAEIISLDIKEAESIFNHNTGTTFTIKFKDDLSINNYYQILVETEQEFLNFRTYVVINSGGLMQIESNDPALKEGNMNFNDGILMKDVLFNGKEFELSFHNFYSGKLSFASMTVTLRTLSEDYFKYITTSQLQGKTSGDPFAQPVNVYTNIENGFGIFGGYSQSVFTRSTPKPVISSFSPLHGKTGDHLIIKGENFGVEPESFTGVSFKGSPYPINAKLISKSENQLEVIVPSNALSGKIIVFTNGRVAISDEDFEIIN